MIELTQDEKAALWLFAFSLRDPAEQQLDARAHIAALQLGDNGDSLRAVLGDQAAATRYEHDQSEIRRRAQPADVKPGVSAFAVGGLAPSYV